MTIKFKDSYTQVHIQEIKTLAQSLGIKLGNQDLQLGFIKSNGFVSLLRSKSSVIFNRFIMPSHKLAGGGSQASTKPIYKFWVECYGNNHNLVKQMFKKRPWLMLSQDYQAPSYSQPGASY